MSCFVVINLNVAKIHEILKFRFSEPMNEEIYNVPSDL